MAEIEVGTEPAARSPVSQRQFWAIAAAVVITLFAGYWFLLRERYVPVLEGIEPKDAGDVVKILEAKKIAYALADQGQTVLVPDGSADKARIELVGSELPMRGQVGFELFNQSDMGLTEFAQKINYQRALQGELARTILLLDGIQAVRVHLGLPERTLFRDERARPKASVAIMLKPGATLTQNRVSGIQRIVAGAVPELTSDAVSVLDGSGRLVSTEVAAVPMPESASDAVIESYRQRVAAAIRSVDPALVADAVVSLRYLAAGSTAASQAPPLAESAKAAPSPVRGRPDFILDIRVLTREALAEAESAALTRAIEAAVGLDAEKGDRLVFVSGFVSAPSAARGRAFADGDAVVAARRAPVRATAPVGWLAWWPWAVAAAAALLVAAFVRDRHRVRTRRAEGLRSFAEQLRERLAASEVRVT